MVVNNLEAAIAVLAAHREARQWSDDAVAADLVAQLGLDPAGNAAKAKPVVAPGITEDEVIAHETAAKEAADKAKASREALNAQKAEAAKADAKPSPMQAQQAASAVNRPPGALPLNPPPPPPNPPQASLPA